LVALATPLTPSADFNLRRVLACLTAFLCLFLRAIGRVFTARSTLDPAY
jgi:hypothetical protein